MNSRQLRLASSIRNVALALEDPAFHTRTINPLRRDLAAIAKSLRDLEIVQVVSGRSLVSDAHGVRGLKTELRTKHLMPIARRAKLVLKGYPGIEESLRLPHARADVKAHAQATKRIVKALRPHASALVEAGFSKDFLVACDRAARAMSERHANPDTHRNRRALATRSIPQALREGRTIVEVIDSHVNAELSSNPLLLSKWRHAKRIPSRIGRPRKARMPRPEA
jgi:hypothetical protein